MSERLPGPPRVAICMPYYRHVEGDTALCFGQLILKSAAIVAMMLFKCSSCYVEENRNGAAQFALQTGIPFDWLLWIDADMKFPDDSLLRLIGHDKDIVGANYRVRTPPYKAAGHYLDGLGTHIVEPGLHKMAHAPTGLLLTRFEIYRKLSPPWFFPGTNNEFGARDDVYFCHRARANGYEVWCDHDLSKEVAHRSEYDITWFEQSQVVVRGSQLSQSEGTADANERARVAAQNYRDSAE